MPPHGSLTSVSSRSPFWPLKASVALFPLLPFVSGCSLQPGFALEARRSDGAFVSTRSRRTLGALGARSTLAQQAMIMHGACRTGCIGTFLKFGQKPTIPMWNNVSTSIEFSLGKKGLKKLENTKKKYMNYATRIEECNGEVLSSKSRLYRMKFRFKKSSLRKMLKLTCSNVCCLTYHANCKHPYLSGSNVALTTKVI